MSHPDGRSLAVGRRDKSITGRRFRRRSATAFGGMGHRVVIGVAPPGQSRYHLQTLIWSS